MKITAIKLVRRGKDAVVEIEIGSGVWVEVIREECDSCFSHIVEEGGMRKAMARTDTPAYKEMQAASLRNAGKA